MIEYDPDKRAATIEHRGLDMAQAGEVFDGAHITVEDDRRDYGEARFITTGRIASRLVVMVWTPRVAGRRIISLRKANGREQSRYAPRLD